MGPCLWRFVFVHLQSRLQNAAMSGETTKFDIQAKQPYKRLDSLIIEFARIYWEIAFFQEDIGEWK